MKIKVYSISAFSKTDNGGNLAGVVLNSENLSQKEMQKIAFKVGFSETAFVKKSTKADFKINFFTPKEEVDLCGHATIATFVLMKSQGIIKCGKYLQEANAGVLEVDVDEESNIFMNQVLPVFYGKVDIKEIADSLNCNEDIINSYLPIEIVSTGLKDIIIPIRSLKCLFDIKPNLEKVTSISRKYGVVGYHLFTLETMDNGNANCRNFAPLYDIPEEAATGTSNGALACYLYKNKVIKENDIEHLIFEQGYSMNRPSKIIGSLNTKNGEIDKVQIGGSAIIIGEKEIEI